MDLTPEVHSRIASGNFHESFQGHVVNHSEQGLKDCPAHGTALDAAPDHPLSLACCLPFISQDSLRVRSQAHGAWAPHLTGFSSLRI